MIDKAYQVSPAPWKMTREEFVVAARPYMGSAAAAVRPVDPRIDPQLAERVRKAQEAAMPHYREVEAAWGSEHRDAVFFAILAGKRVPARVLKGYPELARLVRASPGLGVRRGPRLSQKRQTVGMRQRRQARPVISTMRQGGLR